MYHNITHYMQSFMPNAPMTADCAADPPRVELNMYFKVPGTGGAGQRLTVYKCKRGTSPLEGYHAHLPRIFHGPNYSVHTALSLMKLFNFRWSVQCGITNDGDSDYKTCDYPLLQRVHDAGKLVGVRALEDFKAREEITWENACDDGGAIDAPEVRLDLFYNRAY
jgi:hypothetical protein